MVCSGRTHNLLQVIDKIDERGVRYLSPLIYRYSMQNVEEN